MKTGVALADVITGKDATIAILGALAARGMNADRPVARRRLSVSLAQSAAAALVNVAQNALVTGQEARRWGNAHPNLVPYQLFRAADRDLVIAVGNDGQWQACARALSLDGPGSDPRFATNAGRLAHRAELVAVIGERVRERPAATWTAALATHGVPCGVIRPVSEVLAGVAASPLTGVGPSVPGSVRLPPPRLDEHGAAIRRSGWAVFAGHA
jgi:crotonobetainyl-CoA:carnitine CoA-transferase CaiB-like acyl-CoA transferase